MNQPDLFKPTYPAHLYGGKPPHQAGSDTSRAAADSVRESSNVQRQRVLEFLKSIHPASATDEQMQLALAMPGNTQRPRRCELAAELRIVRAGVKKTTSGRSAAAWVYVPTKETP